ncbi:peptide deformylase [Fructobacillus cardui]|jgi:peptide deformylase|uniref:Peptide deformylase n=1 Tax=Fructobacillus cardui TaxID=2893170 RepID=A0ABN9YLX2_9LACO|nr:peptide deformylase [Fructobacillus cardui]MCK8627282.1 peptide deformylase [Fructobacillus cardui]CAK1223508.1 Peptide deformylase (Def) [Fructobacillus cardui]CAK1231872.1 Peptide deformylase (Def) [Fructobacillus cardui]CAK1238744.1 Peptide deformylase (Def) [Fructobacillus cardui]
MTIRFTMDKITRDGDPVLRDQAQEVPFPLSPEHQQLAKDMMTYLEVSQDEEKNEKYGLRPGVGLAAPQVGESLQMTAILIPSADPAEDAEDKPFFKGVVFNPVIVSETVGRAALETGEGCLSVDEDVPGFVPRSKKITVRYQDESGQTLTKTLRNYPAIVFQHEIDHLHGKLYYDHIDRQDPWHVDDSTKYL